MRLVQHQNNHTKSDDYFQDWSVLSEVINLNLLITEHLDLRPIQYFEWESPSCCHQMELFLPYDNAPSYYAL